MIDKQTVYWMLLLFIWNKGGFIWSAIDAIFGVHEEIQLFSISACYLPMCFFSAWPLFSLFYCNLPKHNFLTISPRLWKVTINTGTCVSGINEVRKEFCSPFVKNDSEPWETQTVHIWYCRVLRKIRSLVNISATKCKLLFTQELDKFQKYLKKKNPDNLQDFMCISLCKATNLGVIINYM